jgi:hypothetical protein
MNVLRWSASLANIGCRSSQPTIFALLARSVKACHSRPSRSVGLAFRYQNEEFLANYDGIFQVIPTCCERFRCQVPHRSAVPICRGPLWQFWRLIWKCDWLGSLTGLRGLPLRQIPPFRLRPTGRFFGQSSYRAFLPRRTPYHPTINLSVLPVGTFAYPHKVRRRLSLKGSGGNLRLDRFQGVP